MVASENPPSSRFCAKGGFCPNPKNYPSFEKEGPGEIFDEKQDP
jgi:hypothetical protein